MDSKHIASLRTIGLLGIAICSLTLSLNATANWEQVDGPYEGHVTSFVKDNGTGKLFATAMGVGLGGGVFVSTDNGDSWNRVAGNSQLGALDAFNSPQNFGIFYEDIQTPEVTGIQRGSLRLGIDRHTSPNTLYVSYYYSGAASKVMRSVDEGVNWIDVTAGLPGSGAPHDWVTSAPNGDMFLVTKGAVGIYRLPMGSSTWLPCTTTAQWGMALAIDQNNGDIYFTSRGFGATNQPGVYRSTDNCGSFTGAPIVTSVVGAGPSDAGGYNRLLTSIAIDSSGATPVIHVGLKARQNFITGVTVAAGGHFRSTDYGVTWTPSAARNVESLTVDPAGRVFLGVGDPATYYGDVFVSNDKGVNFSRINHSGITDAAQVVGLQSISGTTLFAGANGAYRSTDAGVTWTHLTNRGMKATRRSTAVAIGTNGVMYSASNQHGVSRSADSGATWTEVNGAGATRLGSLWVNALGVDPVTHVVYAGTGIGSASTRVWRSADGGANWTKVNGFTASLETMAIVFAKNGNVIFGGMFTGPGGACYSTDGGLSCVLSGASTAAVPIYSLYVNPVTGDVYAGTETDATWLSTNHGASFVTRSWTTATLNGCTGQLGNKGNVWGLTADLSGNTIFSAALHGLFKSTDKGATWQQVDVPGLGGCGQGGWALFTDPSGAIYYHYSEGSISPPRIKRSTDGGATWSLFNTGLPMAAVGTIGTMGFAFNPLDGKLYTGMAGFSYYKQGVAGLYRTVLPVSPPNPQSYAVLDIDRNGSVDALTDGLIVLRYLFGLRGPSMTANALAANATRMDVQAIETYLDGVAVQLDVDANGQTNALTDGLMITRYLLGLRGAALLAGASVGPATAADVAAAIKKLLPP